MNYRNKTIFDWNDFKINKISSIISLQLMEILKKEITTLPIKNVIIRDVDNQIGIILQINMNIFDKKDGNLYFQILSDKINELKYKLQLFAIQFLNNKKFENGHNIFYYKKDYITFNVNYIDKKVIYLLPNSFYQANINTLDKFYESFKKWIILSKCTNMINLGDDGGNVCTILSSLFNKMISYFHCKLSFECALEMIKSNSLNNLILTNKLNDLKTFDEINKNIILFINPGRKGMNIEEILYINESKNITYIIYMACNKLAFDKDMKCLKKYKVIDHNIIINMPIINKDQYLYFIKYL